MFETNSSSEHDFIHMSKKTFELWKCGKKRLKMRGYFHDFYDERDFEDSAQPVCPDDWDSGTYRDIVKYYKGSCGETAIKRKAKKGYAEPDGWEYGTYKGIVKYYKESGGGTVLKRNAKKEYVDPEEWEEADDDDAVFQHPYMEIIDNGRTVTIHIWGS